jgi:hypothetical protein
LLSLSLRLEPSSFLAPPRQPCIHSFNQTNGHGLFTLAQCSAQLVGVGKHTQVQEATTVDRMCVVDDMCGHVAATGPQNTQVGTPFDW